MNKQPYDKIIVGGGIAGLWTAYEILSAAKEAGKPVPKIAVLAEKLNSPTEAGTNIVFGIDGYEENPGHKGAAQMHSLVRNAMRHLDEIVRHEKIECRKDMGYQLLADSRESVQGVVEFLRGFGYKNGDLKPIPDADRIKFRGFNQGVMTGAIGQINVPELERGLVNAIRRMGGEVLEGVSYKAHHISQNGSAQIETNRHVFESKTVPLLATGALHLQKMGLPVEPVYTGAMHVPLGAEDAKKISPHGKPVAFCDTRLAGDVFWGSLDEKNVLTIGFGDFKEWKDKPDNIAALRKRFDEIVPDGIAAKYSAKATFSFGPMARTDNLFPLVGRLPEFDVSGGWASRGVVPSLAAATAYAKWFVNGDDKDLKRFEEFNVKQIGAAWSPPTRNALPSVDRSARHTV